MKIISTAYKRLFYLRYLLFFVALLGLNSCKKDDIAVVKTVKGEAKVKLINASKSTATVDFFFDNAKINSSSLAFGEASDYIKIESGTKKTSVIEGENILENENDFNFVPTLSYTSFFVDNKEGNGEVLTFEDNLGSVENGKARLRFINLGANFTNVINVNMAGGVLLVNALPFKDASGYFTVEPNQNIGISIFGSSTFKIIDGSEFEAGKIYTLWIGGTSNADISVNKITYN